MEELTPQGHKDRVSKQAAQVHAVHASKEVMDAFARVSETKAGRAVLTWLMQNCGYKHSSLTMTLEGVLLTDAIIYNEARRAVWLETRRCIPPQMLNEIEKEIISEKK